MKLEKQFDILAIDARNNFFFQDHVEFDDKNGLKSGSSGVIKFKNKEYLNY